MLVILQQIAEILALLLYIPAFITAFLILKEFRIQQIRFASYFKFLLFQGFIHSLLLVLALFFAGFKSAFLIHSFAMVPLYALLILRLYNLKNGWHASTAYIRRSKPKSKNPLPKIDAQRLKAMKVLVKRKSNWH
ncbi:MAG: hypothetical protein CMP59_05075 [Flavobacteriales bacterium]|nr:hypothetical protein [Flavobacteriales bacterium]